MMSAVEDNGYSMSTTEEFQTIVHHDTVCVKILEQPAPRSLRFRYECEQRFRGVLLGAASTPALKTYPKIKVFGYTGRAVVVVSCVTKDQPYRPHPHSLAGDEHCKKGVCTMEIPQDSMEITFKNLCIQCSKRKEMEYLLTIREQIRVDPFRTGFKHKKYASAIDVNAVRLCFHVFLEGTDHKYTVPLQPIVSNVIYDKKTTKLVIDKLSECSCPADGGKKDIVIVCEKVMRENIQVRFFEDNGGVVVWEDFIKSPDLEVHRQHSIWFKPPSYHNLEITEPVKVNLQLYRPSDGDTSEPVPFEYLPIEAEFGKRKRTKIEFTQSYLEQVKWNIPPTAPATSSKNSSSSNSLNVDNLECSTKFKLSPQELASYCEGINNLSGSFSSMEL